jgi:hypothetical protein
MFRLRGADGLDLRLSFTPRFEYIGGPCVARHVSGVAESNHANCEMTSPGDRFREALERRRSPRRVRGLERRGEQQKGGPAPQEIAVEKAPATLHTPVVDESPVAGEAVVGDRPVVGQPHQLGVHARHVPVPGERDVGAHPAADRDPVPRVRERQHALPLACVAVDEVRISPPLRLRELRRLVRSEPCSLHGSYSSMDRGAAQAGELAHAHDHLPNVPAHCMGFRVRGNGIPHLLRRQR